jgi:hypothetical protein
MTPQIDTSEYEQINTVEADHALKAAPPCVGPRRLPPPATSSRTWARSCAKRQG